MMKWFFVITIFFIYFIQNIQASETFNGKEDSKHQLFSNKYISYEFGIANIVTIFIVDGDTICDVFIFDEKGDKVTTTCAKTPILRWAFDIVTSNLSCTLPFEDNDYKTYYYKLLVIDGDKQIPLSSSSSLYNQNAVCETLIEELKTFIIHLWYTNNIKWRTSQW